MTIIEQLRVIPRDCEHPNGLDDDSQYETREGKSCKPESSRYKWGTINEQSMSFSFSSTSSTSKGSGEDQVFAEDVGVSFIYRGADVVELGDEAMFEPVDGELRENDGGDGLCVAYDKEYLILWSAY